MNDIRLDTLESGMRVVTVPMEGLNSVTVLAMVGVGSRYEDVKTAGISHFLEHMPFKGTKNYPTSLDIASAVDGVGGKHNAFTSKEFTGYWVKLGKDKLDLALDVVSDLLLTPQLREEDINKERGVIIEEINMYEDEPAEKVGEVFDELVYKGRSLERPIIGFKETVGKIGREDFLGHYNAFYEPKNVVVGVVGSIGVRGQGLGDRIEKYFSKGSKRSGGGEEKVIKVSEQSDPRIKIFNKKTEQAHFHLGFPGLSWQDPQKYALLVMTTVLGGNSSSRLFNDIREKRGLAYYAYASNDMFADTGSLYALEGVALGKIDEAVKVTIDAFGKIGNDIQDDEIARAKEYLIGKMQLDLEDSAAMANMIVRKVVLQNIIETPESLMEKIRKVTIEDIREVARRVIDFKKLNLAVVGPFEEDKFRKLI